MCNDFYSTPLGLICHYSLELRIKSGAIIVLALQAIAHFYPTSTINIKDGCTRWLTFTNIDTARRDSIIFEE